MSIRHSFIVSNENDDGRRGIEWEEEWIKQANCEREYQDQIERMFDVIFKYSFNRFEQKATDPQWVVWKHEYVSESLKYYNVQLVLFYCYISTHDCLQNFVYSIPIHDGVRGMWTRLYCSIQRYSICQTSWNSVYEIFEQNDTCHHTNVASSSNGCSGTDQFLSIVMLWNCLKSLE